MFTGGEAEESERRSQELEVLTENFKQNLDVDDVLARLLISEGFRSTDDLLKVSTEELAGVEGLDEAIAGELQTRAQNHLDEANKKMKKLGVDAELANMAGMNADILTVLAENKIKTLDDLGDLATDELLEMLPGGLMGEKQAEKMIMAARAHWFADENAEEAVPAEAVAAEGAETVEATAK